MTKKREKLLLHIDTPNYYIIHTDTISFLNGMIKLDWLWVLTRDPLEIGSADWNTMQTNVFNIIQTKLPNYDPNTRLYSTVQTTNAGCQYIPYP